LYGAYLVNHNNPHGNPGNQNDAWYVGFELGEVYGAGDWAFRTQYEYVQAYSIPDMDVSGIGRGNVLNDSVTSAVRRGNTNYKGWKFEFLYAITDNLNVDTIFEFSRAIDKNIGGGHHYSKFEIEAIYAF
jgi:carbohydrate-binding DOMON domain-containing protein